MSEDIFAGKPLDDDNAAKRMLVVLVADTSYSMLDNSKIDDLNEGVSALIKELKNDNKAKDSVDMSIISFGGNVNVVEKFGEIESVQTPHMSADGGTPMGEAVSLALKMLDARKQECNDNGIKYFIPVCVLMTDGQATDSIDQASVECKKLIAEGRLIVIPIAIGSDADMNQLSSFSTLSPKVITGNFSFLEFFKWLSSSISGATGGENLEELFDQINS